MPSIIIIIKSQAYIDNKAWDAIRLAGASIVEDMNVRVHLLGDAANIARQNHAPVDEHANLEELLTEFIECGLNVSVCGKSLDDSQIKENEMISGINKSSMKELASWIKSSDHCLTF